MKTQIEKIDLTSPEAALAYLDSLDPSASISLPSYGEPTTAESDAVSVISGVSPHEWAANRNQWEWTARELVAELAND